MTTDADRVFAAWREEARLKFTDKLPPADEAIQRALIPLGGEWECVAEPGAITRSIQWFGGEVALVNPQGDFDDGTEADVAMGLRATPVMDRALRTIFALSLNVENIDLIGRVARAAIAYVEMPAPAIVEPDNDGAGED